MQADCVVPVVAEQASGTAEMGGEMLDKLRLYLSAVRQVGRTGFNITEAGRQHAEADFVQCRKANRRIMAEDLHRWLTVSRLLALSHGESELSEGRWEQMKHLEAARIGRTAA